MATQQQVRQRGASAQPAQLGTWGSAPSESAASASGWHIRGSYTNNKLGVLGLGMALGLAACSGNGSIGTPTGIAPVGGVPAQTTANVGSTTGVGGTGMVAADTTTTGALTSTTGVTSATTDGGVVTPNPTLDITSDPALAVSHSPQSAGPMVLRRLSPHEYQNTLADLVGDQSDTASELPDEANRQSGFAVYESASVASVKVFMETAERLLAEGRIQVPACGQGGDETACATSFIQDFGRRAFRRPVTANEQQELLALFDVARGLGFDYSQAVGHVATAMLQSPGFLYLWEVGDAVPTQQAELIALTPHQVASRLSYFLWGTMPDEQLASAADAGQLATPEQVSAQAQRLIQNSERLSATLGEFHLQWLELEYLEDLQKDPTLYPRFTPEVREAFKSELLSFVSEVILAGDATVRSLLRADYTVYTNDALAGIYGAAAGGDALGHLQLNPAERSGLFTMAGFMAATANTTGSNPARRGKLLWESLLCGNIPAPPADVPPVEAPSETTTTRQRFETHSDNPCAGGCHQLFDPLGFAFENYDGIGAYRTQENGMPVDASGELVTPAGGIVPFSNAVELMTALSSAYEVDRCVAEHWFRYMLGRPLVEADRGAIEAAYRASGAGPASEFSVRDFLIRSVETNAFRFRGQ